MAKVKRDDDYRSIYCRLTDNLDFQALPPEAQRLFFYLRLSRDCGPLALFRYYPELYRAKMQVSVRVYQGATKALTRGMWIVLEEGYVWIRNGMRFEPNYRPHTDSKHRQNVYTRLEPIKHLGIVRKLLEHNDLPIPEGWPSVDPTHDPTKALPTPEGEGERDPDPEREPERDPDPESEEGDRGKKNGTPFDAFWQAYPRKTAKAKAKAAWKKVPTDALQSILAALQWQRESEQWQEGIVPHPATYLNQRRWTDERFEPRGRQRPKVEHPSRQGFAEYAAEQGFAGFGETRADRSGTLEAGKRISSPGEA